MDQWRCPSRRNSYSSRELNRCWPSSAAENKRGRIRASELLSCTVKKFNLESVSDESEKRNSIDDFQTGENLR